MPTKRPNMGTMIAAGRQRREGDSNGAPDGGGHHPHLPHGLSRAGVAIAFVVILLVLATTSQGAFQISRWAPLALFVLAVLLGALLARSTFAFRSRTVLLVFAGAWGLAAWSGLSMLWAQSAGNAFEATGRWILYAAVVTLPFVVPISRRGLAAVGWAITVGICVVAVYVLMRLLANGEPLYLAGRLNGPINYRNATALLFAMPFWPLVVATATRTNWRSVRAGALAGATLCLGLAFLTQSRGILIGLVLGGIVALGLGPDRVRRAWVAGLPVLGVAGVSPLLLRPFHAFDGGAGYVSGHDIEIAAIGLFVLTVAAFAVGLALALFDNGLRADAQEMATVRRVARVALAGVVVVLVIVGLAAMGNPVTFARQKWDQFRSDQSSTPTTTRYTSVSGQRYDLWRVAIKEFEASPIKGVGSDNYQFDYYRLRRTNRNLTDPHSLLFSLISENGIIGTGLFLLFLGGLVATILRRWRTLSPDDRRHLIAPAAAGTVLIGQSMVDWIFLIPGLTAIGLFALAVAGAQAAADPAPAPLPAPGRLTRVFRPVLAVLMLGAIVAVGALFLSDAYIQRARGLVNAPAKELSAARTASTLDPWSVTPHYLESSALETMDERPAALRQLRDALALEPLNVATLGVLGDFEARGHDFVLAREYYRRALALDPLDTGLQQLARIGLRTPARR